MEHIWKNKEKGITLIALVITIIILLILAGVGISTLTQTGLFEKANQAQQKSKYANALEKIKLATMASYDEKGNLNNEYLKENLNKIDGISQELKDITFDIEITVDGYVFKINKNGEISGTEKKEEITTDPTVELSYDFKNNSKNIEYRKLEGISDSAGNNETVVYNTNLNEEKNGIIFDGNTTYIQNNLNENLVFPITIETTILPQKSNVANQIIFMEPKSKVGIQIDSENFFTTVNYNTKGFNIPSDFYDGTNKHIIVTYESLDKIKMYINGQELTKSGTSNSNNTNTGNICYLGRRAGGNYFKGIMYNFIVYNKIFQNNDIINMYQKNLSYIQNGINQNDKNNMILEYDIKNNQILGSEMFIHIAKDNSNNENNAEVFNSIYNEEKNGIIFDGSTTYAQVDLKKDLKFPMTIETTIMPQKSNAKNQILFMEPKSKVGIQIYGENFFTTVNYDTKGFNIPSDFYDGTNKHIIVTYESLDKIKMYINGQELTKSGTSSSNNINTGNICYFGRRTDGNCFKGIMFDFKIYNKILDENKIKNGD